MKRISFLAVILMMTLISPVMTLAQQKTSISNQFAGKPAKKGDVIPALSLTEFKLSNGLKVILHRDTSVPVVAINTYYHVGSRDEAPGRTGFAHLFEHMLFQGSKHYPGVFNKPLTEAGAMINGTTDTDRTMYFEVVPSNFLELALFLEADRMGHLLEAMTQEKLDNQRDVVKNEKRQRLDNQPYGVAFAKITETMYPKSHPYSWLTIGSMEDLSAASMDDVKDFFRRYYVPNNATLVLVGDVDPTEARRLVEKYFGPIKRGADVKRAGAPQPALDREIRAQEEDSVALPRVYMSWHGVPVFSEDDAALEMLSSILSRGKTSRLYKSLVYDKQIAQSVFASNDSREIAGLFQIVSTAAPGKTLADIEAMINAEIERIKNQPPTTDELERAYNQTESGLIFGLQTVLGKSVALNRYNYHVKQPAFFNQDLARYRRVTPADIQRVARKYLTDKRFVLNVVPRASPVKPAEGGLAAASTPKPESTDKGNVDTSMLPKGGPDPKLTLPRLERHTLSNGLEVLIVEHHELPVVDMNLIVKTGSAADPTGRAGTATLTAALLDEGTKSRSALDIANQLGAVGATLNTGADVDWSGATMTTLTRHLDRTLDIFADVTLNPSFPESELQRQRAIRLGQFKQMSASANFIASMAYPKLIYGDRHPYGHSPIGDEAAARAITNEDVRRFYETHYHPNNATLIVAGDVQPDSLLPKLEKAFAGWKSAPVPDVDITAQAIQRDRSTIYLIDRPGSAQSVLSLGHLGAPRSTRDYFSLLVLNRILGGNFSSRVNMNLRETKGYTYGARTSFDFRKGSGSFAATADVKTAVTKESIEAFIKELNDIRSDLPVTPGELEFAKQGLIRGYPAGFETTGQIATRLSEIALYGLSDDYFNRYIQSVKAVTLDDLHRVAQRYLDPSRLAILVVGDRQVIEPKLREIQGLGETITTVEPGTITVNRGGERTTTMK